jgi:hypothetical protein
MTADHQYYFLRRNINKKQEKGTFSCNLLFTHTRKLLPFNLKTQIKKIITLTTIMIMSNENIYNDK